MFSNNKLYSIVCCWFIIIIWCLACYEKGLKDSVAPDPGSKGGGRGSVDKEGEKNSTVCKTNDKITCIYAWLLLLELTKARSLLQLSECRSWCLY